MCGIVSLPSKAHQPSASHAASVSLWKEAMIGLVPQMACCCFRRNAAAGAVLVCSSSSEPPAFKSSRRDTEREFGAHYPVKHCTVLGGGEISYQNASGFGSDTGQRCSYIRPGCADCWLLAIDLSDVCTRLEFWLSNPDGF